MGFGWLWGISVGSSSVTSLVVDDDNWGGYACVATGGIWEISVPSSQFYYEPKAALKKQKEKNSKRKSHAYWPSHTISYNV